MHALYRGNRGATLFHEPTDYDAFVPLLVQATARFAVRLLGFYRMPNPFHLAIWPVADGDLSAYMHWRLTTHARRPQKLSRASGHVWQGRFRAFPMAHDGHLLTVLPSIERRHQVRQHANAPYRKAPAHPPQGRFCAVRSGHLERAGCVNALGRTPHGVDTPRSPEPESMP